MKRKKGTTGILCFFLMTVSSNVLLSVNVQSLSTNKKDSTATAVGVNLSVDFKYEKK